MNLAVLKNQRGQTAVEYLLLLLVVMALMFSLLNILKTRMLGNSENCTPNDKAILCTLERQLNQNNFQYFTIKK